MDATVVFYLSNLTNIININTQYNTILFCIVHIVYGILSIINIK